MVAIWLSDGGDMVERRPDVSGVAFVFANPESTFQVKKKPLLQSRLGYLVGIIDDPAGEKTDERETLEPSAVAGESPPLSARSYFASQRGRKPMLA